CDLAYRAWIAVQSQTGVLERRFAATPADADSFLAALAPGTASTMEEFVRHFDTRTSPVFIFDEADAEAIAARGPHRNRSALLAAADETLAGRFRVLGVDVDLGLMDGEG